MRIGLKVTIGAAAARCAPGLEVVVIQEVIADRSRPLIVGSYRAISISLDTLLYWPFH